MFSKTLYSYLELIAAITFRGSSFFFRKILGVDYEEIEQHLVFEYKKYVDSMFGRGMDKRI